MPSAIGRNLINLCFVKIKSPLAIAHSSSSGHNSANPDLQDRPRGANTCSSILVKNFNSLYDNTFDCASKSLTNTYSDLSNTSTATASASTSSHEPEPEPEPEPADLATAFASNRFFFSSPGRSNSIIESTNSSTECFISSSSSMAVTLPGKNENNNHKLIIGNSIAIPTISPDPYADFRRSMQEMVEARASIEPSVDVKFNWEFLHELLLSYLVLNPHYTHKFIVSAFADLLVSLMSSQDRAPDVEVPADNDGR